METKENIENNLTEKKPAINETPEYVEGIPTEKTKSPERRRLIEGYYESLWKELQRENGTNGISNSFLGVNVIVKKGESDKKTINRASADWKSTFAVKHLKQVIISAHGKENAPVYVEPKTGTQKKNGYKNIAILYHEFIHPETAYLNFTVKLTIGIKSDGRHVQYCVNKIEVQNKKPIVSSDYPNR